MMKADQMFRDKVKPLFSQAVFCSVTTVVEQVQSHIIPIGSVVLKDKSSGWLLQKFKRRASLFKHTIRYATMWQEMADIPASEIIQYEPIGIGTVTNHRFKQNQTSGALSCQPKF